MRHAPDIWRGLWSRELLQARKGPSALTGCPRSTVHPKGAAVPQGTFPSHSPSLKVSRSVSWGAEEGFSDLPFHPHSLSFLEESAMFWGSQRGGEACSSPWGTQT